MKSRYRELFSTGAICPGEAIPDMWHHTFLRSFADVLAAELGDFQLRSPQFDLDELLSFLSSSSGAAVAT